MTSSGVLEQHRKLGLRKNVDFQCQSVELEGTSEHVRVSTLLPDGKPISRFFEGVESLHDCFMRGLKLSAKNPCLGWRPKPDAPYSWTTYEEVYLQARNFGSGLIKSGTPAGNSTFIGIYSQNRVEWVVTEQACNMYSMVIVPLYDTLGPDVCQYIVNQVELTLVVCDTTARAQLLLDKAADMPGLKKIVLVEEATDSVVAKAAECQIEIVRFGDVLELGANNPQEKVPPSWEDLSTLCYTSGTTGNPKGAMLSHGNIVSSVSGMFAVAGVKNLLELYTDDVHISYLPLAHVYERFTQACVFACGARLGFYQGDPKKLVSDIAVLKPTLFVCVPRVMNKIYDKVTNGIAQKGWLTNFIFRTALRKKIKEMESGKFVNDGMWDRLMKKVRNLLGGRVRFITTAAAPVSHDVKMFFRCAFGALFTEGYGQTENGGMATSSYFRDISPGHVGSPSVNFLFKLVDVPEMDYYADKDQGEICLKGSGVFKGYFKDPEKTAEAIDAEGWLHTGDIGQWMPSGQLKIIDRKKHIFKMAQGEYIAPEKIENIYIRSEYVAQCFVHGDGLQSSLIAIVVPDEEVLPKLGKTKGIPGDFKQLCANETIKKAILDSMQKVGKEAKLLSFEQVKDIYVESELFSIENNLLTPTFKSKRPVLRKHYAVQIEAMYKQAQFSRMDSVPYDTQK
ncbi:long-chain-fatty-acid--CoA ligase 1-like [Acanthaster planci]|uniref:Long-chain-fatty-acid--CoA ligase n=1 Tax=Acanthaster planci TaxID=133434 RepID=A0A8B7XRP6_ACAPL|nr:long-chain-fatty-acid--CoA ligase 1-like [Acanthaster planci]XP_022082037.1 long-chain-fatty-acid--CoA ligase 1-like [Acanthaster planci]XP_022082867.1 long-chain-fatty-acid--CoA ligase 1-like [Acanthaster planci]XP_022083728.1 long-chain-fatty-acid--CoA ligase 1-like [Acanthaster planci]